MWRIYTHADVDRCILITRGQIIGQKMETANAELKQHDDEAITIILNQRFEKLKIYQYGWKQGSKGRSGDS